MSVFLSSDNTVGPVNRATHFKSLTLRNVKLPCIKPYRKLNVQFFHERRSFNGTLHRKVCQSRSVKVGLAVTAKVLFSSEIVSIWLRYAFLLTNTQINIMSQRN